METRDQAMVVPIPRSEQVPDEAYLACIVEPDAVRLIGRKPGWLDRWLIKMNAFSIAVLLIFGTVGLLLDVGPGRSVGGMMLVIVILLSFGLREEIRRNQRLAAPGVLAWLELHGGQPAVLHAGGLQVPLEEIEAIEYLRFSFAHEGEQLLPHRRAQVRIIRRNRAERLVIVPATRPEWLPKGPGSAVRKFAAQLHKPLRIESAGTSPLDPAIVFINGSERHHPAAN